MESLTGALFIDAIFKNAEGERKVERVKEGEGERDRVK